MKRTLLAASVGFSLLVGLLIYVATFGRSVTELSEAQFSAKFQSNLIAKLQVSYPPKPPTFVQQLRGTFYETDSNARFLLENGMRKESRFRASFRISDDLERQLMTNTNVQVVTLNPAVQKLKDFLFRGK